jgi:MOSC domain-containing protein YiiM
MQSVAGVQAVADFGLEGDRHARAGQGRQVLLIENETLNALGLAPGMLKENVTTQGIDLMSLSPGQRLHVGRDVVLEISGECEPCERMDEIRAGLRAELAGRRGMNSRVIRGGSIQVGDPIVLF